MEVYERMASKKTFTLKNAESYKNNGLAILKSEYNFRPIERNLIVPNPMNDKYSQDGIEELKDSILDIGLINPLYLIYNPETNLYRLVSGERRYRAFCAMTDEEYKSHFPTGIPSRVKNETQITPVDEEITLIVANAMVRDNDSAIKTWQLERLYELYEEKKRNHDVDNILKYLSKQLNISEATLYRVKNVVDTEPEIRELYDQGELPLKTAEKLVQVNPAGQKIAAEIAKETGKITPEQVDDLKRQYPQSRKELNQRKKGIITKPDISEEEIKSKVEEFTSVKVIPEVKKINFEITSLLSNKDKYDVYLLKQNVEDMIERLQSIIENN